MGAKDVQRLEPMREESKKMILYPLFLVIKDIDGYRTYSTSMDGDYEIFIPAASWYGGLGSRILDASRGIPSIWIDGIIKIENGYKILVFDGRGNDDAFDEDMQYLARLWGPYREPSAKI